MQRFNLPVLMLVSALTNLIPLYGVYNWGWAARDIILLYWLETVFIGVTYVLRIWTKVNAAEPWPGSPIGWILWTLGNSVARAFTSIPFVAHFGGFCFILGMAVLSVFFFQTEDFNHHMYRQVYEAGLVEGLYWAALGVLIGHLLQFALGWFWEGRYVTEKATTGILRTYARIFILIVAIVLPANTAAESAGGVMSLWVLVGFKISIDLIFLKIESRSEERRPR